MSFRLVLTGAFAAAAVALAAVPAHALPPGGEGGPSEDSPGAPPIEHAPTTPVDPPSSSRARFIVEATTVHAVRESEIGWLGSDEIYAAWQSDLDPFHFYADTRVHDMDSGDAFEFQPDERCILPMRILTVPPNWPHSGKVSSRPIPEVVRNSRGIPEVVGSHPGHTWRCSPDGIGAPLEFDIELYEEDWGTIVNCFGDFPASFHCGDDFVGGTVVRYSSAELLAALPHPLTSFTEGVTFQPGGVLGSAKYRFFWRVTRVADAPAARSVPSAPGNLPGTDGPTTHAPED